MRKEGVKLKNFTSEKENLKLKIKAVNEYFELNSFVDLIRDCKILRVQNLFSEMEQWLFDLLKKEGLEVVNGILAVIYFDINNKEYALIYAEEAKIKFPGVPIWDAIIYHSEEKQDYPDDLETRWEALLAEIYGSM